MTLHRGRMQKSLWEVERRREIVEGECKCVWLFLSPNSFCAHRLYECGPKLRFGKLRDASGP